jgi:hypothetical protein
LPNGVVPGLLLARGPWLDETKVPPVVGDAACELARALLVQDRTDDPEGEGLRSLNIVGSVGLVFDAEDRQPVVPSLVQSWLGRFGEYTGRSAGMVRLVRT